MHSTGNFLDEERIILEAWSKAQADSFEGHDAESKSRLGADEELRDTLKISMLKPEKVLLVEELSSCFCTLGGVIVFPLAI